MPSTHSIHRVLRGTAAAVVLSAGAGIAVAATPPAIQRPTPTALAQFPVMAGFQISPDGKHMLAIESQGDQRNILVWRLADLASKPTVIGSKNMQIRSAAFLKNDLLQVEMTQPYDLRTDRITKTFISKLYFTDLEGKKWVEPMPVSGTSRTYEADLQAALNVPTILNRLPKDPDHIVLLNTTRGESQDVYRYNVRNGSATRLLRLGETDNQVWVNNDSLPWAKSRGGSDEKGVFIAIDFRDAEGAWQEHFRSYVKDRDVVDVVAPGLKPGTAIIRSNVGEEFARLLEYSIAERKILGTVFAHRFFDALGVRSLTFDEAVEEQSFDGFTYEGLTGRDEHWENPEIDAVIQGVAQALGLKETKQELRSVGSDSRAEIRTYGTVSIRVLQRVKGDVPTYLLRVSGPSYPTEHYLLSGPRLSLLAKSYPQIDRRALGTSRFVYYKARDGLNIPAFLTLPNETLCGPGPYAAVVHPHGGPWARDVQDYDASGWVPLLVGQCRVVLQPQFRGSAGWGRTLWYAGDREWGQKMQDDKDDGAQWLISEKLADPKRIAMFGFSYGGYAAFAAAVRPNGLYKCAISGAGVSDIERIWARFFTNPFFRQRQEPTVRGLSPLTKAHEIQIPIMVYHGDRDQTVPLRQSELFVDKAKASGKPVEFHVLKDYAHGPAWTRDIMSRQLEIIDTYLTKGCGGGL